MARAKAQRTPLTSDEREGIVLAVNSAFRKHHADACMKTRFVVALLQFTVAGCAVPITTGPLIDSYSRAECVPVKFGPGIHPPSRAWDHDLSVAEGFVVHVSGAAIPGGRITLKYGPSGEETVAADAGDYIYPADVRFDRQNERLYIKASGAPAAFGGPQLWLFEYDLRNHRQTGRALIDPNVLPQECPETQ